MARKKIRKEQKVGYWTIITNIVLVLTTVWLGLAVQDFVADKNANVSSVLARVEYINSVKPSVDALNIKHNSLLCDIDSTLRYWKGEGETAFVLGAEIMFVDKMYDLLNYYDDLIETSKNVMYYLDDTDDDEENDELEIKGDIVYKIGILYSYKEVLDFYYVNDTLINGVRKANDSPILHNRLRNLYRSPEYIETLGLNIRYDSIQNVMVSKYQGFFENDGNTIDTNSLFTFAAQSLDLALNIHKILNNNRTYRQNDASILEKLIKAPWSILLISIILIWIVFTIIVFVTGDDNSKDDDVKMLEKKLDSIKKDNQSKIELVESNLHQTNVVLNDSIDYLEKTLDELTERLNKLSKNDNQC